MINYEMGQIRNIAFLGHRGSGKTSLTEALLYMAGNTKKKGSIESGTTVSDYDKEEVKYQFSINTSIVPIEYKGHKYNILDTPGYFDFVGEVLSATRVAGGAVIVVDATAGVEVGTEKVWEILEEQKTPRIIFLNKMDKEIKNYNKLLEELKEKFGKKVAPFCIPVIEREEFKGFVNVVDKIGRIYNGKECVDAPIPENIDVESVRSMLLEAVAEVDEKYMEKYFNGEEFTLDEIHDGLHRGVCNGDIVPVIMGSSSNHVGVLTLFDMMFTYMPTPNEMEGGKRYGKYPETGEVIERIVSEEETFSAIVFKTLVDPFIGKISLFKVNSGVVKKDMEVLNSTRHKKEKISHMIFLRGNSQIQGDEVRAGDIGAATKLQFTKTGDTICCKDKPIVYDSIEFPKPCIYYSIEPKNKNDDEKLSTSLQKICEEDPSYTVERNVETKEMLLGCRGEKHLNIAISRAEIKFGVHCIADEPKIAYRETIKERVEVQGKHKKQTGGAGQFADVYIKFEPCMEEFEFVDNIHGGVVPKSYIPAVEKGLIEAKMKGSLGGYPVINFKATLFDGSYHNVDSSEMAFKLAAILAFKKAMEEAKPVLLEPIMKMEIEVLEIYVGDIMGDLNKRRGKIGGINTGKNGKQIITAEVPYNEILKYALDLNSMTQGRGNFHFDFAHYSEFHGAAADKIIFEYKEEKQ
ncbi:MAG: elongation factor G [Fusobacteriaceae bacterium]|nr:elongation factor G [Fusobacteriaceae bacterium]MBP6322258.1 elongation factor G [Fusobacteriaceae bacterium]MBP9509580.1 elongation factor G [Fusobacteriaceae bacterium]